MKPTVVITLLFLFSSFIWAQEADTIELKNINVTAGNDYGTAAIKTQKVDSLSLSQNLSGSLGELLQNATPVFVKQYGSNGAQTVTFRGMAGTHTGVFLNGLNINPGSLGLTDLSVYPTFLFKNVGLKYGNAAFTEGNGAIGGGIMLSSEIPSNSVNKQIESLFGVGSFGKQEIGIGYTTKKNKFTSSTRFYWQEAQNDFEYTNLAKRNSPIEKQNHAYSTVTGVHQQVSYELNKRNMWYANILYSFLHRELPKLMTANTESRAAQTDQNAVFQLGWKNYRDTYTLKHVIGYCGSDLKYRNPASNTDALTINHKLQFRQDYKNILTEKSSLNTAIIYSYATASNPNLNSQNSQSDGSFLAMFNHKNRKLEWSVGLKPGFNNNQLYILPLVSVGYVPLSNKTILLGASLAQNKKFASLNDLYWQPGGNPDLLPETANTGELNATWNKKNKRNNLKIELNGYCSQVSNWILWKPSGNGYWMAQNVQKVLSYGTESALYYTIVWEHSEIQLKGGYNWVQAINQGADEAVNGKQLIYTPAHQANLMLFYSYKRYGVSCIQNYFGKRYTASDNSSSLPAYFLTNLHLHAKWNKGRNWLVGQLEVNNLLDESYMAVAWQPMMGRNVMVTLKYEWK